MCRYQWMNAMFLVAVTLILPRASVAEEKKEAVASPETIAKALDKGRFKLWWFGKDEYGLIKLDDNRTGLSDVLPVFISFRATDEDLKDIPAVPLQFGMKLEMLPITDVGVGHLKNQDNLTFLNLHSTKISDAALKSLKDLKNLSSLDVSNTEITDEGAKLLKEIKNLSKLNITMTKISDKGLKEIVRVWSGGGDPKPAKTCH